MHMKQPPSVLGGGHSCDGDSVRTSNTHDECQSQNLLTAVEDNDCRIILDELGDETLSTSELSEKCNLPLSTTYRKVDILVEAGLLEAGTRLRRSGKHTSEYSKSVENIVITLDSSPGIAVQESRTNRREHAHPLTVKIRL